MFLSQDKLKTHMMRNHGYSNDDIKNTFKVNTQGRQRSSIVVNRWVDKYSLKFKLFKKWHRTLTYCFFSGNGPGSWYTGESCHKEYVILQKTNNQKVTFKLFWKWLKIQGQSQVNGVEFKLLRRPRQPPQPQKLPQAFDQHQEEKTMRREIHPDFAWNLFKNSFWVEICGNF